MKKPLNQVDPGSGLKIRSVSYSTFLSHLMIRCPMIMMWQGGTKPTTNHLRAFPGDQLGDFWYPEGANKFTNSTFSLLGLASLADAVWIDLHKFLHISYISPTFSSVELGYHTFGSHIASPVLAVHAASVVCWGRGFRIWSCRRQILAGWSHWGRTCTLTLQIPTAIKYGDGQLHGNPLGLAMEL